MSNAVAKLPTANVPALALPEGELMEVLRASLYPGAADNSIKMVLGYCKATGLDPMQKPVHIVPMWDKNAKCTRDVIMPGIGMYRTQAARSGDYVGMSEPVFGPTIEATLDKVKVSYPEFCRVTVRRRMGDVIAEFPAVEYWLENYATAKGDTDAPNAMWKRRPFGQLAKCAEAQALRKAFPEFGAAPTAEEMEGAVVLDDEPAPRPKSPAAAAAANLPEGYEAYASEHLQGLRDASLKGSEALVAAMSALASSPLRAALWRIHSADLKAAAEKADAAPIDVEQVTE